MKTTIYKHFQNLKIFMMALWLCK